MADKKKINTNIIMAFVTVFFDMMNNALVTPILPYLVQEMNSTSMEEGVLYSSYAVMQLISLLIMGPLSDKYGRKPFLLLSLFGSCFGSLFQGLSRNMVSLIIWRAFTGLFAGSLILVQAVIADLVPGDQRSIYITRLEACNSAAYIVGPAIGGILGQVSYQTPLLFAGGASGIALLLGFFFLKESNPRVLDEEGHYHIVKTTNAKTPRIRPKLTSIMIMCFLSEFCVRWALSAYNSRYGFYISDRWQVPSTTFSTVIVFQSLWCAIIQYFIYPWLTSTLGIPIPYLAVVGYVIMIFAYVGMAASPVAWGSLMCSVCLWTGNNLASPSSVAIISTSNRQEIQGEVLSWNNFCYQGSLIVAPLILSAVYIRNRDATYYLSAGIATLGTIVMIMIACRKDAKVLGKQNILAVRERSNSENSNGKDTKAEMKVEMSPVQRAGDELSATQDSRNEMSPVQPVPSEVSVEMNPSLTPVSSESVVNNTQTSISV